MITTFCGHTKKGIFTIYTSYTMKPFLYIFLFISFSTFAQKELFKHTQHFTRQDTLRGSITPERAWWNLKHYALDVEVFPKTKYLAGSNTISFEVLSENNTLQIDLQEPMKITAITHKNMPLSFVREGYVYWVTFPKNLSIGSQHSITVLFEGTPTESKNPPWSGGITWKKDKNGTDFIASANQGIGASIWWPNKDHHYDEPDNGITIAITTPAHLTAVSNGRLTNTRTLKNNRKTFLWEVKNPINNYGVNINIGDYVYFSEKYAGEKGTLDCEYWVLKHNLKKAKKQFKQATMTLEAFEHWFGPYPFYEDSYKLVEAPYLGMEHQSSVTYGNNYANGYLGRDLSGTGVGLKFDFIIVHESGHEWFANNITNVDAADMWIHESFTAYSESLFLDYHFSTKDAETYVIGTRRSILNDKPLIGVYNVNNEGSGDIYYKGANMLHTLRQIVNDDNKWRFILREMNRVFYHQQVSSAQVEQFLIQKIGLNLNGFFDQYLRTIRIPEFTYTINENNISFQFTNAVENLEIPVKVWINNLPVWLKTNTTTQEFTSPEKINSFTVDKNFYIKSQ